METQGKGWAQGGAAAGAETAEGGCSRARPPPAPLPAWYARRRTLRAGRPGAQGGGALCTMAYPGHPGAGGGYYPGGVSAACAGPRPGRDPWTPRTPRDYTWGLRWVAPRAPPDPSFSLWLPRPRPRLFSLSLAPSFFLSLLSPHGWLRGAQVRWIATPEAHPVTPGYAAGDRTNWVLASLRCFP